ncbi:MAG: gamma-glutamyltransferase [Cloacibacillus sp.]
MEKAARLFLALIFIAATAVASMAATANEVYAKHGMVSAANELASKAGVEIMQKGGNAIDAAVATALALNVVEFNASGIGGGGFMTIRDAKTGKTICLDYRETAPQSATKEMYASDASKKAKESIYGGKSVGVPGWLKGMTYALDKYGTMKFKDVAAPAIRLAEEGFVVAPMQNEIIADNYETLAKFSGTNLPYFEDDLPIAAGKVLKQPALGKLFRLIGEKGPDVFYKGEVADAVVRAVERTGGKLTKEDLAGYKMFERTPITGSYRGYQIYSMPPSSSGGTHIVQLLNIMENFDVKAMKPGSAKFAHVWAEATKLAFADRGKYMADTAFVKVPLNGLQSKAYAKTQAAKIDMKKVNANAEAGDPWKYDKGTASAYIAGLGSERQSTSSFSVVDQNGNIVTSTNTINYFCGSSVYVPEYGFLLNDEMDDFSQDPKSVNAPEPGKRPLSSMSPTIVLDPSGRAFMSIGAAGATRIITAVSQIIMNVIDFGMEMDEAIEQTRFHNQSGTLLRVDQGRTQDTTMALLGMEGYKIEEVGPGTLGTAQGILFDHAKGRMNGGADSRRLGVPVGF